MRSKELSNKGSSDNNFNININNDNNKGNSQSPTLMEGGIYSGLLHLHHGKNTYFANVLRKAHTSSLGRV